MSKRFRQTAVSRPFPSMILIAGTLLFSVAGCRDIFGPGEGILTIDVAASRVPCQGAFPQECFQVRQQPNTTWTLFYDSIEGFDYEVGFEYTIRVGRRAVPNPPADGSSFAYRLLSLLRKVPA